MYLLELECCPKQSQNLIVDISICNHEYMTNELTARIRSIGSHRTEYSLSFLLSLTEIGNIDYPNQNMTTTMYDGGKPIS